MNEEVLENAGQFAHVPLKSENGKLFVWLDSCSENGSHTHTFVGNTRIGRWYEVLDKQPENENGKDN